MNIIQGITWAFIAAQIVLAIVQAWFTIKCTVMNRDTRTKLKQTQEQNERTQQLLNSLPAGMPDYVKGNCLTCGKERGLEINTMQCDECLERVASQKQANKKYRSIDDL